ncbi:MAG TPA: hypothetical protein VMV72_01195 [Verrucomicrobiae bacterium]|nr:hypothetical protein [Verrucomicrobiae bacterium]
MSTPDEIESDAMSERDESSARRAKAAAAGDAPMEVLAAIGQLRLLICGLGVGLLVMSLAFTAFVYKQNRNLVGATALRERQLAQLRANDHSLSYLVNSLVKYSAGKPELTALLARHGLQTTPPTSAPGAAARP